MSEVKDNIPKMEDNQYIKSLEDKIRDKEEKMESDTRKAINGTWGGGVSAVVLFSLAYFCYFEKNLIFFSILFFIFIALALVCLAVAFSSYHDTKIAKSKNIEIDALKEDLELEKIPNQHIIIRADKQFKINQKDLQRYYDLNLTQTRFLSKLGIFLIIFGLVIISTSILLYTNLGNDLWLLISGTISGVLVDFIGAIFIVMYTKNLEASIEFHSKLADSNKLLLANSIATKINNESLRESTLSEIAKGIACKDTN